MNDVLTGVIITGSGRHTFQGLYDEYGNPVKVVLDKSDEDVVLSIMYDDDECELCDD